MYNNRDKFKERVVMASGIYAEIKKRILDAEYGAVFVTSDFTDIATITTTSYRRNVSDTSSRYRSLLLSTTR